jgi:outer membrane murein-binding lipoprotein Lpp
MNVQKLVDVHRTLVNIREQLRGCASLIEATINENHDDPTTATRQDLLTLKMAVSDLREKQDQLRTELKAALFGATPAAARLAHKRRSTPKRTRAKK